MRPSGRLGVYVSCFQRHKIRGRGTGEGKKDLVGVEDRRQMMQHLELLPYLCDPVCPACMNNEHACIMNAIRSVLQDRDSDFPEWRESERGEEVCTPEGAWEEAKNLTARAALVAAGCTHPYLDCAARANTPGERCGARSSSLRASTLTRSVSVNTCASALLLPLSPTQRILRYSCVFVSRCMWASFCRSQRYDVYRMDMHLRVFVLTCAFACVGMHLCMQMV